MVKTPGHQAAIAGGLAHFCGLPRIEIDGDTAMVTSYLQIITPHPTAEPHEVPNHGVSKGFRIHRVGSNRWDLVRTAVRLEDQAPHAATARRLGAGARTAAPRRAVLQRKRLALALIWIRLVRRMLEETHRIVPGVSWRGRNAPRYRDWMR